MIVKVCCVDDEQDVLEIVKLHMRNVDCELTCFNNPVAALESVRQEDYAVVLSDVHMPEMSGHDFIAAVRAIKPSTICINMSSFTDFDMVLEALAQNHIYDFIKKPLKQAKFLACVRKALDKHRLQRERDTLQRSLVDKNAELTAWNKRLDEEVARKTRELRLRDELLQHLAGCQIIENPFAVVEQIVESWPGDAALGIYARDGASFKLVHAGAGAPKWRSSVRVEMPAAACNGHVDNQALAAIGPAGTGVASAELLEARVLNRYDAVLGFALLQGREPLSQAARTAFAALVPLISLLVYDGMTLDKLDDISEDITKIRLDL